MAHFSSIGEPSRRAAPDFARRSRQVLLWCLAASAALHALALTVLPQDVREPGAHDVRVLDVVLLGSDPLPVPVAEPRKPLPPKPTARRARRTMPEDRPRTPGPAAPPVFARPAPNAAVEPARDVVPPPVARDPVPITPGERQPSAPDGAGISPPVFNVAYLHNPPPAYPLVARRNGEEGTVLLKVLVTAEGVPAAVAVERSSGSSHLDDAAVEAVRTWRFTPARRGDRPVEAPVLVPVVFRLQGAS